MKRPSIFTIALGLLIAIAAVAALPSYGDMQSKPELLFYYGHGCPHCVVVEKYFDDHRVDRRFSIIKKEVYGDAANAQELADYFVAHSIPKDDRGVPFAVIDGKHYVGDTPIIKAIESAATDTDPVVNADTDPTPAENVNEAVPSTSDEPANRLNFAVVTGAALVDAINPCEFAVLIILMATVLAAGHRKRALASGLLFSLAVYLSYLAMGLGLYSAIAAVGVTWWIQRVVGVLAILLGLFNLKDAVWYGKGFLLEVPMGWRPRMKALLHSVTNPLAALLVGFVVSLFLLPCTSGPYIVIVGMLGAESTFRQAVWWLVYYNLIFILPMLAITFAVFFGFKPESLENIRQKRLRLLHAVAGVLLLGLGMYLLVG